MGKKLPPNQMELYRRIDEILFYKWDPIGISDLDWSRDEYQTYLPQVFQLTLTNDNPKPIAEYLTWVTIERMGLKSRKAFDLKIAELLINFKEKCLE
jgi:hypothetical protein